MYRCCKTVACFFVVTMFAVTLFAQTERAMLYPGQDVRLNGNSLQTSSAVTSGDKIHTGNSEAQLTGRGLLAVIEKDSTLHYGDVLMVLECGALTFSSSGTGVQGSDTKVMPANGMAKFRVENRGGKLTVTVQSGIVRVTNDQAVTLAAGQSAVRSSSDSCPVLGAVKPAAPAADGRGKIAALVLGGDSAATAGVFLAGREKDVSPDRP